MSLASVLDTYRLDAAGRAAVTDAYEVFRSHHGPFVTSIAAQMLPDLRRDAAAGHAIAFLGRDGFSLAEATRALDPDFFARHCHEVVLSRAVVEAAVQDLEQHRGASFPDADGFRGARDRVNRKAVPGSYRRLTQYLRSAGLAAGRDGSAVTVVDSSFKGTVQELLAAAYPETTFRGRYMIYGASPHDRHPGTKVGYAVHLPPEMTHDGLGLPFAKLPADEALTLASSDGLRVIEDTLHGPLGSPTSVGAAGPDQRSQRDDPDPLRGLNPALVIPELRDPNVREATKAVALVAVHDAALDAASRQGQPGWLQGLMEQRRAFVHQTRTWLTRPDRAEPGFRRLMDSLARGGDKNVIGRIHDHLRSTGVGAAESMALWQTVAQLPSVEAKNALADQLVQAGRTGTGTPTPPAASREAVALGDGLAAVRAAFPIPARAAIAPSPRATGRPPTRLLPAERQQGTERD